jgi:serine/threonine protein kinase/class 3 adenylate cyclase
VDAVLAEALDRPPESRSAFLDEACAGDAGLRDAVERLLRRCEEDDERLVPGGGLQALDWEELAGPPDDDGPGPGSKLGPYEIVALLGEGGMGRVFRARDTRLQREVALKVLDRRSRVDAQVERFGREARSASALNHPNIVTIYDIGGDENVSYIAMECIDGESLREKLSRGPLQIDEVLALAEQVAAGLAAAHARDIVHRDLKPANVMVTRDGTAKIVDFGLAKRDARAQKDAPGHTRTDPLTLEGVVFGTVGYMSPEQARGEPLDYRSDLFSFGALLYEMLTGTRAFARPSTAEVLAAILKEPARPISEAQPDTPPSLQWAIERCLKKDPKERYESTRDLARDLGAAREHRTRAAATGVRCVCGADNPRDHRFCSRCGAETRRPCPGCGEPVPTDALYCGSCGHGLRTGDRESVGNESPTRVLAASADAAASPSTGTSAAMASERRQATILVTRLTGYESLLEEALPEEVERLLADFETSARDAVDRFGGRIDSVDADEVVALFGIPAAHEDDALRAVRCALELQRIGLKLGSAVHTGLVVVHDSDATRESRRAVGEAVNVTRALAQRVDPGHVVLSPESRRLAGASIRSEPLKAVRLRAGGDPVVPERVLGVGDTSTPPLEVPDARLTAFSGRQAELGTLMGCVESAVGGEGHLVTVVGDAGAGKSRLFYELRRQLDRERITLVEGRCQSHGERAPYLPLIQACRAVLGVRDEDPAEVQLAAVLERVSSIDPGLDSLLPLYLHLLSIHTERHPLPEHLEGKPFRHAMQEALVALFTLASRENPVVLILEDWHWVDEASHDAIRQLVEMCPGYPLLVAVSYRPDAAPDWGTPGQLRTIHLAALGPLSSDPGRPRVARARAHRRQPVLPRGGLPDVARGGRGASRRRRGARGGNARWLADSRERAGGNPHPPRSDRAAGA